jgi:hypothetical protein
VKVKGRVATPLVMDAVPKVAVAEAKVTVPVGLRPETDAVKVSCWFVPALTDERESVVLDATGAIASESGLEELGALLLSPG